MDVIAAARAAQAWWAQWAKRQVSSRVKNGSVQGECMHTAEAVTENSQTCAPAAPALPANDRYPLWVS